MKSKKEYKHHQPVKKKLLKSEQDITTDKWKYYIALIIILIFSFIAYLPVFHNSLLVWDDDVYIKNNPLLYSLNLRNIFSQNVCGNYHPFTILTFAGEYLLFGLNPAGYHTVNLLLHLLNVILVFYVVFLLCDKPGVALVAALLFGIHPLHVESVAWAAELKDVLYTFFFLSSYICYLKYLKTPQKRFYLFALLLFLISLLSKAMAASLPAVLLLTDYFKGRRINTKTILEKVPFFLLAIVFGVVAVLAQKSSNAIQDIGIFTFPQRFVFATYSFIIYLIKLLAPLNLSSFYPYPVRGDNSLPIQYYAYILFFFGIAASIIYSHHFSKKIIFGMGFFCATVFLVLQFLPVGGAVMADRYTYIPSIGIFYLAGEGFFLLWRKKRKAVAIIILGAFTIFFSVKTYARCGVWKNDMTLWNNVISQYQNISIAYYERGNVFRKEKRNDEAIGDFNKAIELKQNYSAAYINRGDVFFNEKRNDEAISDFNKAIELNPGNALAYNNRGTVFFNEKRNDEALSDFNKSIELKPDYPDAYFNRGNFFMNEKRNDDAFNDFNKAIELKPDYADAYNNRGNLFMNEKRNDEALNDFNKAIELKPDYADAYNNRGTIFLNENRNDEALKDFNKAIQLTPDYADAYNSRGTVFMNKKRNDEAINNFNKAIELKPDFAQAYYNRGNLFYNENRNDEALSDFKKAIELKPDYPDAYNNMGNIFYNVRRNEDAIIYYTKAIAMKTDYAMAYYNRGIAEYYSNKKDAACMDLRQAASLGYKPATQVLLQICK